MAALLSPVAKQQFTTDGSTLAAGYRLYTYASGTNTPQATFQNRGGTVANTNPIILDARGEAIIYLTPGVLYRYVLKTDQDVTVWTQEEVIADAGDANAVTFTQYGVGAVVRSTQDKMRELVSITDYGAVGGGSEDITEAVQKAHDALPVTGGTITIPNGGWWLMDGTVNITKPCLLKGAGSSNVTNLFKSAASLNTSFFLISAEGCSIQNISMSGPGATSAVEGTYAVDTTSSAARLVMEDVQIQHVACGVRLRSNVFSLRNVEVRHFKALSGVGFKIDQTGLPDGVGELSNCLTETAGGGSSPFAGCQIVCGSGIQISDCDFMQSGRGMSLEPASGQQAVSINCSNTFFDTSASGGVTIFPTGTGNVARLRFDNCWFCSATIGAGFEIGPGCQVSGCLIADSEFYDNVDGLRVGNGAILSKLMVSDCVFTGNDANDITIGTNVTKWSVRGCEMGAASGFPATPNGLFISAGCDDYTVYDNRIHAISDSSTATNRLFGKNRGVATTYKNQHTITAPATNLVFAHGLYKTPQQHQITVTPLSDTAGSRWWVSAVDATNIQISVTPAATIVFGVRATLED